MLLVVERDGVDRVDLVLAVEVGVEAVHHHHQLVGGRAPALRVDDEDAVESLVDVPLDGDGVAVIELESRGLGVELVDVAPARRHHLEGAVHVRRVDAVEVHRVGVAAAVLEAHADPVALGAAERRARHLAVIGPCRIEHPGCHLDLPVLGDEIVLPERLAAGEAGHPSHVELGQERRRVERSRAQLAHRHHVVMGGQRGCRRAALRLQGERAPTRGEPHAADGPRREELPPGQAPVDDRPGTHHGLLRKAGRILALHASSSGRHRSWPATSWPITRWCPSASRVIGPRNGSCSRMRTCTPGRRSSEAR